MAKQLSKRSAKATSPLRRFSDTMAIPEALHQPSPKAIPLQDLATRLGVSSQRLLPAIKAGYVKVVCADPPTVYEPPPAAIAWLREMFTPLMLRPLLEIAHVADLEGYHVADIRRLAIAYNIPIHMDACFGEMFTIAGWKTFHAALHYHREPSRFDRQAMLFTLLRLASPEAPKDGLKPPPFTKRLEREIKRIAELEEPHRTEQALRLWENFEQSKKVVDSIANAKGLQPPTVGLMNKVERMIHVPNTQLPAEAGTVRPETGPPPH